MYAEIEIITPCYYNAWDRLYKIWDLYCLEIQKSILMKNKHLKRAHINERKFREISK